MPWPPNLSISVSCNHHFQTRVSLHKRNWSSVAREPKVLLVYQKGGSGLEAHKGKPHKRNPFLNEGLLRIWNLAGTDDLNKKQAVVMNAAALGSRGEMG